LTLRLKYSNYKQDLGFGNSVAIACEKCGLRPDEVMAVIKNVKNQVEQVASQLPAQMRTELPTHVGYLGIALVSKDKSASKSELDYVMNNLKKASEVGSVTPEWMETTRIDLEKINWATKRLS